MALKQLQVNLDEVADAMDQFDREISDWYLDTKTGQVISVSTEMMSSLDDGEEEDEEDAVVGWQAEALETARQIAEDADDRFHRIPEADRHEAYAIMEEFIHEVPDLRLRDRLARAISGKGAFRRFKDELSDHPDVRERWFEFEREQKRQWARDWLEELDIESTWEPPVPTQKASEGQPTIVGVDHVQITIPSGSEQAARDFYCGFLGLAEVEKPESLRGRGGLWLQCGDLPVHLGVEDADTRRATKAHVAYLVTDLPKWRDQLLKRGIPVIDSAPIPGYARFEFRDPFGNRVEFVQPTST